MNKSRRKALGLIEDTLSDIMETLDDLREDEQGAFACMPNSLHEGKGDKMLTAISNIKEAIVHIGVAITAVSNASR